MKRAATLCFLLLLASCYGLERVDQLRQAPAAASPFHQELARLYLAFVDKELDKYDWDAAGYFAAKGLDAAHGKEILPEDPKQWDIPAHAIEELGAARAGVIKKLSDDFKRSRPQDAASLLFAYDCWVEEQEEAWEARPIEQCKNNVLMYFNEVDEPVAMGGPLSTSYLFHFPKGKAMLDGLAREELGLMAKTLAQSGVPYSVLINGHGEIEGSAALSAKRASYLRGQLQRGGVPKARIAYHPRSDVPAPKHLGGGYEQRIEIFIE